MTEVALREHIEALFTERDRATDMASAEREKAAAELRRAMEERIQTGDKALHDHIEQQVLQIRAALTAVERLRVTDQTAQKEAVEKAFEASNALAAKHNDLIRAAERKDDKFLPREVYEGTVEAWTTWRQGVDAAMVGKEIYEARHVELENQVKELKEANLRGVGRSEGVGLSARTVSGLVSFAFIAISLILVIGDVLTP